MEVPAITEETMEFRCGLGLELKEKKRTGLISVETIKGT